MSRQIMFRTRYIKTLILAVAAVAAACTADPADPADPDPDYDAEPVSLTIDVSIADLGIDVSTRATDADTGTRADANTPTFSSALSPNVTKYLNPDYSGPVPTADPELTYYNQAKSIDGSVMTCLTVILVHRKTNRIVGIRRIPDPDCPNKSGQDDPNNVNALFDEDRKVVEFDENGNLKGKAATHARITFNYEDPYHVVTEAMVGSDDSKKKYIGKSAERLVRGEYSIMVVANYDHSVTTSSLKGSGVQTLNVNKVLNDIAKEFHQPQYMAEGIYPFAPVPDRPDLSDYKFFYDIRFLMNRTLERVGSDDGNNLNDVFNVVELPIDKDGNPIKDKNGNPIKPYIRPAVQQTLSAAKEFYLEASNNHLELELLRISSRTRVEVKNNSTTTPLKVHSLEFSNNYTQSTIYLFRRDKNDRDYGELANKTMYDDHDGKGAPIVSYTGIVNPTLGTTTYGAIVPFDEANGVDVSAGEKKCIFDALMYESNVKYKSDSEEPDSYTYTIDVSYPGITNYRTTDKNKLDPEKTITENVAYVYRYEYAKDGTPQYLTGFTDNESLYTAIGNSNTSYFLIQSVGSQQYLFEKDDGTICAGAKSVDLEAFGMTSYLWTMEVTKGETGDLSCTLKNVRSGKYMGAIPEGTSGITSVSEAQKQPFSLSTAPKGDAYNVAFATSYNGTPYYLNVWGGGLEVYHGALGGWNSNPKDDINSQFYLYPLTRIEVPVHEGTPRIKKEVKLTTFNDETAIVEDVHEIQRNDFVRILVEVSCNPAKSDFDFEVNSWVKNPDGTDKGGDVTFN